MVSSQFKVNSKNTRNDVTNDRNDITRDHLNCQLQKLSRHRSAAFSVTSFEHAFVSWESDIDWF